LFKAVNAFYQIFCMQNICTYVNIYKSYSISKQLKKRKKYKSS